MTFVAVDSNRKRLTELTSLLLAAFPGSVIYQHTDPMKVPKDVRNNHVDAVFAQIDMGNLGGTELTRILRAERANLPVFLLTDDQWGDRPSPENNGTACLARPLSAELLRESLKGI